MAKQTEDVITAIQVLHQELQQLHQFDWSSGHKKRQLDGLAISSMNLGFGGKGNLKMRCSKITTGCIGDGEAILYRMQYKERVKGKTIDKWFLHKPEIDIGGVTITEVDCKVKIGVKSRR